MKFREIFEGLKEIGYEGWVTVELYPFQDDAPAVAERAFHYLQSFR